MNALCAPLSVSVPCVTMWPSLRRSAGANERSLLTHKLVQRLGADHSPSINTWWQNILMGALVLISVGLQTDAIKLRLPKAAKHTAEVNK